MHFIDSIQFGLINPSLLKKEAACRIFEKRLYSGKKTCNGGILDGRLGASSHGFCETCGGDTKTCPGHLGYIELSIPCFDLKHIKKIIKILNGYCFECKTPLNGTKCRVCGKGFISTIKQSAEGLVFHYTYESIVRKPKEVFEWFRSFRDQRMFGFSDNNRAEWMVLTVLPVPPISIRPTLISGGLKKGESQLTILLLDVLRKNVNDPSYEKLQEAISVYLGEIDAKKSYMLGLAKKIKGKTGRIRLNIMGKRCNFTARSVITPNPFLDLDEVGVPVSFAKTLTIRERVNFLNIDKWKKDLIDGENVKNVITENGDIVNVENKIKENSFLKIGHIVERAITDGDIVLFNRQPTLHRMSMMAHRVKLIKTNTFQLNLSVTSPYNADFDGDEMNMHVPQTLEAIVEAKELMSVSNHIVSPQSNKPVMGLVQDSLLGVFLLCKKDVFMNKKDAMFVLDSAVTIQPLNCGRYSGRDVFSCILPKTFNFKKGNVSVTDGRLEMSGDVNKNIMGAVGNGIVHVLFLNYGKERCQQFIQDAQKMASRWMHIRGFSIGVGDIKDKTLFDVEVDLKDKSEIEKNAFLNKIRDDLGKQVNDSLLENNSFKTMVTAGSKGSNINISQIMGMVGQQNLCGCRIAGYGLHKRTLPSFKNSDNPNSMGFVRENYKNGLSPTSYFFHAVGGREGLVDTAVKTAETGYLQHKIIKSLENIHIANDQTVRDSQKNIIQLRYGGDGFDACRLIKQNFDILTMDDKTLKDYCHAEEYKTFADIKRKYQKERVVENSNDTTYVTCVPIDFLFKSVKNMEEKTSYKTFSFLKNKHLKQILKTCSNVKLVDYIFSKTPYHKFKNKDISTFMRLLESNILKSIVPCGEMVGVVAAQSIGEPCTQMTLNTFHFAGVASKNVTLGIPRLYELLNCSKNIKTPIIHTRLKEKLAYEYKRNLDSVFFSDLISSHEFLHKHDIEIIADNQTQSTWTSCIFYLDSDKMDYKRLLVSDVAKTLHAYSDNIHIIEYSENDALCKYIKIEMALKTNLQQLKNICIKGNLVCTVDKTRHVTIDANGNLLREPMVELCIKGDDLHSVAASIKINGHHLHSNDIVAIYRALGVEAARKILIKEINAVISFDGSYVNNRHVSVLVDYMTNTGHLTAINRSGLRKVNSHSIIHSVSFEQPVSVLAAAAVNNTKDPFLGVSENLFVGHASSVGFQGACAPARKKRKI